MKKFFKNNSKLFYILGSLILVVMIGFMVSMLVTPKKSNVSAAQPETWKITVNKTSAVTVYVSGKGVTFNEELSTDNTDIYNVEKNTIISLRAVNESRIFSSWELTGNYTFAAGSSITSKKADLTPTSDMTVATVRKDALAADFGEYMNSRFYINLDIHLLHLQRIFEAQESGNIAVKEVLDAYDYFFEKERHYEQNILLIDNNDPTTREQKAELIKNDNYYFNKIQNGYYQVNSSFSLMDESFNGIGSYNLPFNGVLDGNVNGAISNIFITSSSPENTGNMYRGLFQATGENAVIRNIKLRVSLGISAAESATNIYIGGIAGRMNKSVIANVDILSRISVDSSGANIFAGSIAGELVGGLDHHRNVLLNGKDSTFILSTNASGKSIYSGLISGNATNVYVKEVNADVSNFAISGKNTGAQTYSNNTNIYIGNLFGKYTATEMMPIERVNISGTTKETLTSLIHAGNSYIGGLIGHLTATQSVELGDIKFSIPSGESKFSATSVDANSQTNLFTAGLIAVVEGNNLKPRDEFLDGIVEKEIDGVKRYEYNYIFNMNLKIESLNHGMMLPAENYINTASYGKAMATGFIARGYMNLDGADNNNRNNILLTSGKYLTKIYATQSSTTKYNGNANTGRNDKEHCIATAFYGNLNRTGFTIQNLNIFGANYDIAATRELGSFGKSDVYAAGFIAYTENVTLTNISVFLNDSYIKGHSLSYEVANTTANINNNFVGGVVASVNDTDTFVTMSNILFAGNYDHLNQHVIGTTSVIEGMQNTKGNDNYRNENYVGGVFGRIYRTHVNGVYYYGSESEKDAINSLGHEDPATAFCGGVIGYVKNNGNGGTTISAQNCEIYNAKVYIAATVTNRVDSQPDVYIGGIIGSTFHDTNGGTITINNAKVINTDIIAEGNEHTMVFNGGVIGDACWSGTVNVENSYVIDSNIESHLYVNMNVSNDPQKNSAAGGIMGRVTTTANIRYCAVIDTNITATYRNTYNNDAATVNASGIFGERDGNPTVNITGCYSNATVSSSYITTTQNRNGNTFGIIDSSINGTVSNSYYVSQNVGDSNGTGTSDGTGLDFSEKEVTTSNTAGDNTNRLFGTSLGQDNTNKLQIQINNIHDFGTYVNNNHLRVYAKNTNSSSYADIWINAKQNGDTKTPADYVTEDDLIRAGWFNLGSLIVYNGDPSQSAAMSEVQYSYIIGDAVYILKTDGKYYNQNYPYDIIDEVPYDITIPHIVDGEGNEEHQTVTLDGKTSAIKNKIEVNIMDDMLYIKLDFSMTPSNYFPALYDKNGNLLSTSGLLNDDYGKFEYSISGDHYYIIYRPNVEIDHDDTFYIGFLNEDNSLLFNECFQFDILHNEYILIGAIFADYTKPINYQFIEYNNDETYLVRPNTITKIIPVFRKTHSADIYISELNISKVTYRITSGGGSVKSNGEITSPGTVNSEVTLRVTSTFNTSEYKEIKLKVVNQVDIHYSSIGADLDGLVYATSESDYILDIDLLDHYGGDPIIFNVDVGESYIGGTFESPIIKDSFDQLTLYLGGAEGTVQLYLSSDEGANWSAPITINVTNNYASHSYSFNGYNKFRIVNSSNRAIGISKYSLTIVDEPSFTANIEGAAIGATTINDTFGDVLFTMSNATVKVDNQSSTVSMVVINNTIPNGSSFDIGVTNDNDIPESNWNSSYRTLVFNYTGNADIKLEIRTSWWNDTWEERTLTKGTNTFNNNTCYDIRITINNTSNDFKITELSYGTQNNTNNNTPITNLSKNVNIPPTNIKYIGATNANQDVIFTFNNNVKSVEPILLNSSGSFTSQSVIGKTYTFRGNANLKIGGLNVVFDNNITYTYTFYEKTSTTTARFTCVEEDDVDVTIDSCTEAGTNLGLYTNASSYDKAELIALGWIDAAAWDIELMHYRLTIPASVIATVASTINISIEFPVTYSISFDLQSDVFNPDYTGETFYTFKVKAGTTFNQLFGTYDHPTEQLQKLITACGPESSGGVKKFGYVFGGFYLIDNGNSMSAYSISLKELLNTHGSLQIQSSFMYYARWSFLIELIEAPGTNIETSFESGFMEDVGLTEQEREELELNNSITIPINNNRGYVFTVEKEEGFIGEAQVNAYIVTAPGETHKDEDSDGICDICNKEYDIMMSENVTEITIEKYHDNMYLYFIPPEAINGYLVIVSSVTNSSIIVGKNTASVTEQILPEDGVFTFKYVVNHKKNESYIYDNTKNLLDLGRDINIKFYDQIYNGVETSVIERHLLEGTTIEVYYSLYENGVLSKQIVGALTADGGETSIRLKDFNKWNQAEKAFNLDTFRSILKDNNTTTEVFYFVVTPPNGQNTGFTLEGNEIINEVIYVGYCDADGNFIQGRRNDGDISNLPIEDHVQGIVKDESSKQEKIYSITPSRQTSLTGSGNNYTFTDITTYHILDLYPENSTTGPLNVTANHRLVLDDSALNNTIIYSSTIKGYIRDLELKLGFNTGLVKVYGRNIVTSEYELIQTFNVDSDEYKSYFIDFEKEDVRYDRFMIDNVSENEIRLESFKYVTMNNAMTYEFTFDAYSEGTYNKLSFINSIKGDTRHDGKSFILAVEYDGVTDISENVSITINGTTYMPLLSDRDGRVCVYFNLSEIISSLGVTSINITLNNDGHTLSRVRLLEATSSLKPAVSEERVVINN